jgi:uncharacterized protein YdhG (YjbR/CyaY superfamily)
MKEKGPSRNSPEEVDEYLSKLPEEHRTLLQDLRSIIHETMHDVKERVSYKIPIFRTEKDLVGISSSKNHCSLHTMSHSVVNDLKNELKGTDVSGATIHFFPGPPLERDLVRKILQARLEELDTKK